MFRQASSREWRQIVASALAQAGIASWEYVIRTEELWWSDNAGPLVGRERGFTPESFEIAQKLFDQGDHRPADIPQILDALEGGPVEVDRRAILPDKSTKWIHHRYFLMTSPSGEPQRLAGMMTDVDQRKRRENEDAVLNKANEVLMGSLDLTSTVQATADLLVPDMADWCAVDLLDEGMLKPVARAHVDPAKLEWAAAIQEEYPPDMDAELGPANVVRTGEAEIYQEIPDDMLVSVADGDERLLEILREVGYKSVIVVPLHGRKGVIGTMTLVTAESDRYYDERSLRFAERLASQMAVAIETAQLYTRLSEAWRGQRVAVETLQRGLAPDPLPELENIDLAAHYEIGGTGKVGGDWYEVLPTDDGTVCFVIGDVVGRGVPAVAAMARYRSSLRTLLLEGHSPGAALTTLNKVDRKSRPKNDGFATIACFCFWPDTRKLAWAAAGHLPALLRDGAGARPLWDSAEPPIYTESDTQYHEESIVLDPDVNLILYTDGLIERKGESIDMSLARLVETAGAGPTEPKELVDHLLQELPNSPSSDDVAILVARIH